MGNDAKRTEDLKIDNIRDKVVVLLGEIGVGKSSFINCITKKNECKISHNDEAFTQNFQRVDYNFDGNSYYFIEIPGLHDEKRDDKNISELVKKYQKITSILICLSFSDCRLTKSLIEALKIFMDRFPSKEFWQHVLIIRTKSIRYSKFEKDKKKYEGKFLEGINSNNELSEYMKEKGISTPKNLQEFYVDSYEDELDDETKQELENILRELKNIYPLYKSSVIIEEEKVYKQKENGFKYLNIQKIRNFTFTDYNDEKYNETELVSQEKYNLETYKSSFLKVKRIQENKPRACYPNQFKTYYKVIFSFKINEKDFREEYDAEDFRWEEKGKKAEENGNDHRLQLENYYRSRYSLIVNQRNLSILRNLI